MNFPKIYLAIFRGIDCMFLSCHVRVSELFHTLQLPSFLEAGANHLTRWLSVHLRTKWFWVRFQLQSLNFEESLVAVSYTLPIILFISPLKVCEASEKVKKKYLTAINVNFLCAILSK